jgi:ribosomal protein S18 acetylase RimI-like enzyme
MKIVRAQPEDADALTNVALAAKRHWGYPEDWIRRWEEALTVTPLYVRAHPTYVAQGDKKIVGFCALLVQPGEAVLDHLWVLPAAMGMGVGRALFLHAEKIAREAGAIRMKIVGDPHAEGFYRRMGARVYGREPAAMDNQARFLPLLEKALA